MPPPNRTATFDIHVIGETTGETYTGQFEAKQALSHLDTIKAETALRGYLGDPAGASPAVFTTSKMISELLVRITKSPDWWKDASMGEELVDSNVLQKVFEEAVKVQTQFNDQVKAKAQAAQQLIRDTGVLGDGHQD